VSVSAASVALGGKRMGASAAMQRTPWSGSSKLVSTRARKRRSSIFEAASTMRSRTRGSGSFQCVSKA
jgi:hypothetical protein